MALKSNKGCLVIVLIPVACVVGLMVYGLVWALSTWVGSEREASRFDEIAGELRAGCDACFAQVETAAGVPVRLGRVLIVDAETGKSVASANSWIGDWARAHTPEELAEVACVTPPERHGAGTYSDGSMAYRLSRNVCVFAWPDGAFLFGTTVWGSDPPAAKSGPGDKEGSDPVNDELPDLLEQAPHQ